TIGSGQQMQLSGLSNVLNAQTSYSNNMNNLYANSSSGLDGLGALVGGAAKAYSVFNASDRRLKTDIKKVGKDEATGLNKYQFKYKGGDTKYEGVMADEAQKVDPSAVMTTPSGYKAVNYAKLGLNMKEVRK
ncbi:MAG TPA: tail fiber domain-containing protein, partial [Limnobacter sp.]|uniref:tail fiber domain-containing protein n=1 Tax=Limnobacter sp. TaxID=2003368 RepID=UPI002E346AB9